MSPRMDYKPRLDIPSTGATPSVLLPTPLSNDSPASMEGFGSSTLPEGSDSPNRRQRITMACQYCRHRKIRCCGGSPCRNCARSQRECEYAPVPEEVNRATREKKALAKASKAHSMPTAPIGYAYYSPMPNQYSPYFSETPVFEGPYVAGPDSAGPMPPPPPHSEMVTPESTPMSGRPSGFAHRRSVSVPNFEATSWMEGTPNAPQLYSPATFESPQWMYNGWNPSGAQVPPPLSTTPQASPYPHYTQSFAPPTQEIHVPSNHTPYTPSRTQVPHHHSMPTLGSVEEMAPLPAAAWSTPSVNHLQVPSLTPGNGSSPVSPNYYTPFPTPPQPSPYLQQHHSHPNTPYPQYGAPPAQPVFTRHDADAVVNLNSDSNSPTLAPEMTNSMSSGKDLVGLGIGLPVSHSQTDVFGPGATLTEDYFAAQAGY